MRKAVRIIVIHDDKLLVMHRNKFGKEYDTLPGGGVDMGESLEHAALREIAEETSLQVQNLRPVFIEEAGEPYGTQYVFVADYVSGTPQLRTDTEEAQINALGQNLYEPRWVAIADLPNLPFVSERLKDTIISCIQEGFPAQPLQIR